ncbi:MAG: HEPN domain-containing protein [Acidobacteriota bacterium]
MIPVGDLKKIAKGRLLDADALFQSGRYDGAIYLCGYAVEIALKARICRILKWTGYPSTRKEFEGYQSFRTHDLDILLHLSGAESNIKTKYFAEWSVVATWKSDMRYRPIGSATAQDAMDMLKSAKTIVVAL